MVRVFLSHSSKDKPFVRELADALEAGGEIKVWLDEREIGYGENIVLKIGEGLDADAVLLILSPDSVESKWVKEEWTDAYWDQTNTQNTKLAGVLYRDCQIPRLLRNKKYFDLRTNQTEGFREIRSWLLGLRSAPPPIIHLPQRPALFIERGPELEDLRNRLREPGSVAYISGLAGRGKTTLALEYAHRHQRDYESVHWLPCQGRTLVQIAGELTWQLGLKLEGDIDTVFASLIQKQVDALVVTPDPLFTQHRDQVTTLAARHAVPAVYWDPVFPKAGGLMSYGSSVADMFRQVGIYAGRILKGEKPAEMPVMQATKFELLINLKTAKALGLTIPPPLLGRADEVIE